MTSLRTLAATTPGLPCQTIDPELWFSTNPTERHYAAQQCRRTCPLLLACMRHALHTHERHGVWGGVDFQTRTTRHTQQPHHTADAA